MKTTLAQNSQLLQTQASQWSTAPHGTSLPAFASQWASSWGCPRQGSIFLRISRSPNKQTPLLSLFLINFGSFIGSINRVYEKFNIGSYRAPWPKNITENDKFHTAAKPFGWFMLGLQGTDQGWVDERGQNLTFTNWAENFQTVQNPPR